ncbi:MAG: hypothetical protein J2P54_06215 [Bradyrhizobiaceae bacterium]|nr:hypothetical protein [Bradyrhizobiaceae bacterium]
MMENWFATLALILWPGVALWLYSTRPIGRALAWTILGGLLLLPVGAAIKLAAGIPQLDKISIPNLAALLGCVLVARRRPQFFNRIGVAEILLSMSLVGPFITSELNGDVVFAGGATKLPPIGNYEALSAVVNQFIFLLPFFLGRQFLRKTADTAEILRVLTIAGLLYSIPMLIEIRLSPQLHRWIYGYAPSDFIQEMRFGGFRPMVFMGHGLIAAFFMMTSVVAAVALWRAKVRVAPAPPIMVASYLSVLLVLCKSIGALLYGLVLAPLVRLAEPRMQLRVAALLATFALAYPMMRMADLVPTRVLLEWSTSVSRDRADSLKTRFVQEGQLLERASQRVTFGWGRFGRSRVYDESGRDISITDGRWIITIGQFGLFGFLAEFGLLAFPIFSAVAALRFAETAQDRVFLAALALILAINIIDLLPNSSITPWTWLISGALLGRAEALRAATRSAIRPGFLFNQPPKEKRHEDWAPGPPGGSAHRQ